MLNVAQLETDLKAAALKVKTLFEATMRTCQDAVVTPARPTKAPAVIGRLMTAEEKGAVQALIDDGKAIKDKLDHAQGDAKMIAQIAALTAGMDGHDAGGHHRPAVVTRDVVQSLGQQYVDSARVARVHQAAATRSGGTGRRRSSTRRSSSTCRRP